MAVCHRECRHWFWGVSEGKKGRMEEGSSDAWSCAQPALQLPLSAWGRITDLWTPRSLWVSCWRCVIISVCRSVEHVSAALDEIHQCSYYSVCLLQMFWDLTTLTASSRPKESALPWRSCSLTTYSPRRPTEGLKNMSKLRETASRNQEDHSVPHLCCL